MYFNTKTAEFPTIRDKNIDDTLKITFDQNANVPPFPHASLKEIHPGLITSTYIWSLLKKTCGTQIFCFKMCTIWTFFMLSHITHTCSFRPGADKKWSILCVFSIETWIFCDRLARMSECHRLWLIHLRGLAPGDRHIRILIGRCLLYVNSI